MRTPLRVWREFVSRQVEARVSLALTRAMEKIELGTMFAGPDIPEESYELAYQAHAPVYSCVNVKANNVAMIPFGLYRKKVVDGRETWALDEKSPVTDLLSWKPNKWWSPFEMYYGLSAFLDIVGGMYWFIARGAGTGRAKELLPLRPDRVRPIPSKENYIKHYEYLIEGSTEILSVEDVIYFRQFNPHNDYYGQSTFQAAKDAITNDGFAKRMNNAFFKNGAAVDWALVFKHSLSEVQYKRHLKEIQKAHNTQTGRRWMVLDGGEAELKTLSANQRDMDFYKGRKTNMGEIAMASGTPPTKLSSYENANYNTAHVQDVQFFQESIIPRVRLIRGVLNTNAWKLDPTLLNDRNAYIDYDVSQVPVQKQEELNRRRLQLEEVRAGTLLINEFREEYNRAPLSYGNEWYPQRNQVPISELQRNPSGKTVQNGNKASEESESLLMERTR